MSAENVCDFLIALSEDANYKETLEALMDKYNLTEEEKQVVRSGDSEQIKKIAGGGDCPFTNVF